MRNLNAKDLFYINLPCAEAPNVLDLNTNIKIIFININTMSFCNKTVFQSLLTWVSHTWETARSKNESL